jgi:hypothetical protein
MAIKDMIGKQRIMSVTQNPDRNVEEFEAMFYPTDEVDIKDTVEAFAAKPRVKYTITFDGNTATTQADPTTMEAVGFVAPTIAVPAPPAKLPAFPETEPTKTSNTFAGWFTAAVDGTQVTLDTEFVEDTTVYAQWTVA